MFVKCPASKSRAALVPVLEASMPDAHCTTTSVHHLGAHLAVRIAVVQLCLFWIHIAKGPTKQVSPGPQNVRCSKYMETRRLLRAVTMALGGAASWILTGVRACDSNPRHWLSKVRWEPGEPMSSVAEPHDCMMLHVCSRVSCMAEDSAKALIGTPGRTTLQQVRRRLSFSCCRALGFLWAKVQGRPHTLPCSSFQMKCRPDTRTGQMHLVCFVLLS